MMKKKHILLFEAFSAKAISKTLDFIEKQIDKNAKNNFLNYLKKISKRFDLPFDNIDDNYFEYLGKKDAVLVRNSSDVDNTDGIFCLKFWFSIDKGYMGYTYTGNVVKKKRISSRSSKLTKEELDVLGIKSGKLTTIKTTNGLKTGDILVGYLGSEDDVDRLVKSTVWRDSSTNKVYCIQNIAGGNTPSDDGWEKYGRRSWIIAGSNDELSRDNHKLALYIDDGSELSIDGDLKKDEPVKLDPLEFNLPMDNKYPKDWGMSENSIYREEMYRLENVDFAIIFYYDEFTKARIKRPSEKRSEREESKLGAAALMSDEQIKRANLERYTTTICNSFGVTETEINPRNLQKVVAKMLNREGSIYNLINNELADRIYRIYRPMVVFSQEYNSYRERYGDSEFSESVKNSLRARYEDVITRLKDVYLDSDFTSQTKSYEEMKKRLKSPDEIEIFNKVNSLSLYISSKISQMEINNIEDLIQIRHRLISLRNILTDDTIGIKSSIRYYIDNSFWANDAVGYIQDMVREKDKTIKQLERIERHIKSVL